MASDYNFDNVPDAPPPIPPRNPLRLSAQHKADDQLIDSAPQTSQDTLDEFDRELKITREQLVGALHDDRGSGSGSEKSTRNTGQKTGHLAPLPPLSPHSTSISASGPNARVQDPRAQDATRIRRESKRDTAIVAAMDVIAEAMALEQQFASSMYSITDESQNTRPVANHRGSDEVKIGRKDVGIGAFPPIPQTDRIVPIASKVQAPIPSAPILIPVPVVGNTGATSHPRCTSSLYSTDDLSEEARFEAWLARGVSSPTSPTSSSATQGRRSRVDSTSTAIASQRGRLPAASEYGVLSPYATEGRQWGKVGLGVERREWLREEGLEGDVPEPLFARRPAGGVRPGGHLAQSQHHQGQFQNNPAQLTQPFTHPANCPLPNIPAPDTSFTTPRVHGIDPVETPPVFAPDSVYNPYWNQDDSFWKQHHEQHGPATENPLIERDYSNIRAAGTDASNTRRPDVDPSVQRTAGPSTTNTRQANRYGYAYDKALPLPPPGQPLPGPPPRQQGNTFAPPPVTSAQYPQDNPHDGPQTSDAEFFHAEIYTASPHGSHSFNDKNSHVRDWLRNAELRDSGLRAPSSIAPSESASQIFVRKRTGLGRGLGENAGASPWAKVRSPVLERAGDASSSSQQNRGMHYPLTAGGEGNAGMQKWPIPERVGEEDLTTLESARHVVGKVARFILAAPSDPRLKTYSRRLGLQGGGGEEKGNALLGLAQEESKNKSKSGEDRKDKTKKRSKWTLKGKGRDSSPDSGDTKTPFNITDIKIVHTHNPTLPDSSLIPQGLRFSKSRFKGSSEQEPEPANLHATSRPYAPPSNLGTECTAWPEQDSEGNMFVPRRRYDVDALKSRFSADSSLVGDGAGQRGSVEDDYARVSREAT